MYHVRYSGLGWRSIGEDDGKTHWDSVGGEYKFALLYTKYDDKNQVEFMHLVPE
jgi:hypothetical protein